LATGNQKFVFFMTLLGFLQVLGAGALWAASPQHKTLRWVFPILRTHTGVLLGNGKQGLMVYGDSNHLNVVFARAGFWDRRSWYHPAPTTSYAELTSLIKQGNMPGVRNLFKNPNQDSSLKARTQQYGGGRLDIYFSKGWKLAFADLHYHTGVIKVILKNHSGVQAWLEIRQSVYHELTFVKLSPVLKGLTQIKLIPAYHFIGSKLKTMGIDSCKPLPDLNNGEQGFVQYLPADEPLAVLATQQGGYIRLATALGNQSVSEVKKTVNTISLQSVLDSNFQFWRAYWHKVPGIKVPDAGLQEAWDYGLYKQACANPPHGIACTLQGPFMEEYQLAPWCNDYHFNINAQMIYWPALATNCTEHLAPLWNLLHGIMPAMQQNGTHFFGNPKALLLPHATNDNGQISAGFWTGAIDQGSLAWMARLAWLQYKYTLDTAFLHKTAWPLLSGAFEGYYAMMDSINTQGKTRYTFPVTVSPEFRGARNDAWGRDASFQLAACHSLTQTLPLAAKILNKPTDLRWQQVEKKLPPYTLIQGTKTLEYANSVMETPQPLQKRIALWDSLDLIESHRHHSHLAGIFPFVTYSPQDTAHKRLVYNSLYNWLRKGAGTWTGWSTTWAAAICARANQPDAAITWLHYWQQVFVNEGRGTLHDARFPGTSTAYNGDYSLYPERQSSVNTERMQLDAGFGALTAIQEICMQQRGDSLFVLPILPLTWKSFSFTNMGAEGGLRVSARVKNGQLEYINVKSTLGGSVKIVHNLGNKWLQDDSVKTGNLFVANLEPGQEVLLEKFQVKKKPLFQWNPHKKPKPTAVEVEEEEQETEEEKE
jgi:alpha-L-fucosidase 2